MENGYDPELPIVLHTLLGSEITNEEKVTSVLDLIQSQVVRVGLMDALQSEVIDGRFQGIGNRPFFEEKFVSRPIQTYEDGVPLTKFDQRNPRIYRCKLSRCRIISCCLDPVFYPNAPKIKPQNKTKKSQAGFDPVIFDSGADMSLLTIDLAKKAGFSPPQVNEPLFEYPMWSPTGRGKAWPAQATILFDYSGFGSRVFTFRIGVVQNEHPGKSKFAIGFKDMTQNFDFESKTQSEENPQPLRFWLSKFGEANSQIVV